MCYWKKYLILSVCLLLWTGWHVYLQWDLKIPVELENKTIVLTGEIIEAPVVKKHSVRFLFKTNEYGVVQLDWYRTQTKLHKNQIWELPVRLKNPRNYDNPGGFNFERFLFLKKITATGYVDERANPILRVERNKPGFNLRQLIANDIDTILDARPQAALIKGLAVGIRDTMTDAQWQLLQKTGTSHLLAISGLHIGLVSGFAFFIMRKLWSILPRMPLYCPAPVAGAIAAMIAAFIYSALAGFAIPTQRALIMIIVFMLCICLRFHFKKHQVLLCAATLVILWDPFALMSASFWLSFIAVALLFYIAMQQAPKWQQYMRIQWYISLGLTPFVIFYFQQISWVSPLANIIAIPYASFTVVPLTLLGVFANFIDARIATFFWLLAESALNYLQWFLGYVASFSWAWQTYVISDVRVWFAIIVGVILLLMPRGIPGKLLGLCLLVSIIFIRHPKPEIGEVWLTVLDVGQGLAIVVQTFDHVLLYDAGMRYDEFDLGEAVIMPFLRHQGINQIDTFVLSHDNLDHTGGADYIIKNMPVKNIISGEAIKGLEIKQRCLAGLSWRWDQVEFEFLYPVKENPENSNNNSCVLKISSGQYSALLTGDIEKAGEAWLVEHAKSDLKTNILLAPHHGSSTSSTLPFVKLTDPDYVIFSTGYLNRYKFPNKNIVNRYSAIALNTATDGAVRFEFDQKRLEHMR
jgi:competence protein ComEC